MRSRGGSGCARAERLVNAAIGRRSFLLAAGSTGLAALGVSGCAESADSAGQRTFRTVTYIPPSYDDLFPGIDIFMDTVASRSAGRARCDMYDSGVLLAAEQLLPGLLLGTADLMVPTSSYISSTYPILGAIELPFGAEDFSKQRRAWDPDGPLLALINEALAPRGVRVLGGMPTTFEYLWTVDRPILRPEDARGLRIRVAGQTEGETVKALGAAPVTMSSGEVYQALERGTIDGLMSYIGTVVSRDLQGILRYGTLAHFGGYTVDAYCRSGWYAEQPTQIRSALDEAGRAMYRQGTEIMAGVHRNDYLSTVVRAGVELIEPNAAQLADFRAATAPAYRRWRHAVGDPALADRLLALIKEA